MRPGLESGLTWFPRSALELDSGDVVLRTASQPRLVRAGEGFPFALLLCCRAGSALLLPSPITLHLHQSSSNFLSTAAIIRFN